jgi:broad specificity phosphatase PhoE
MLGVSKGMSRNIETFSAAKNRIKIAVNELVTLAEEEQSVIVFGHGMTNRYMRKELIKRGWTLTYKSNDFWGETCLIK